MRPIVLVSIALFLVVGCGPGNSDKAVLKGTITYKGQPVNAAGLVLNPTSDSKSGVINISVRPNGTFESVDVPPGDYRIVVQAVPPPNPNMSHTSGDTDRPPTIPFPDKYKSIQTSDLTCSIKPGDTKPLNLELKD